MLENIRDEVAGKEEPSEDDEVLDLTQKVNEDGSITDLAKEDTEEEKEEERLRNPLKKSRRGEPAESQKQKKKKNY